MVSDISDAIAHAHPAGQGHRQAEELAYYPLAEVVYRKLLRSITDGAYPPGASLSVALLAQRLGVSKTPVREALSRLAQAGLVVSEAHRGAVVAEITWEGLEEIYLMRQRLEGLAAACAARRRTSRDLEELEGALAELRAHTAEVDMAAIQRSNVRIHQLIWRASQMRRLEQTLSLLQRHVQMSRSVLLFQPAGPGTMLDEHTAIVRAVADRDPELAEERMTLHIRGTLEALRARHGEGRA